MKQTKKAIAENKAIASAFKKMLLGNALVYSSKCGVSESVKVAVNPEDDAEILEMVEKLREAGL